MSFSRPTRPAYQTGHQIARPRDGTTASEQEVANTSGPSERRLEHCGGYAVLAPNEKKRSQTQKIAETEAKRYEAHRQQQRKMYTTSNGAVGGDATATSRVIASKTQSSTRGSAARVNPTTGTITMRGESMRSQSLRANDADVERHKATQRQRAEANARKDQNRQQKLDTDRLRVNNNFLDRLEGKK